MDIKVSLSFGNLYLLVYNYICKKNSYNFSLKGTKNWRQMTMEIRKCSWSCPISMPLSAFLYPYVIRFQRTLSNVTFKSQFLKTYQIHALPTSSVQSDNYACPDQSRGFPRLCKSSVQFSYSCTTLCTHIDAVGLTCDQICISNAGWETLTAGWLQK